MTQALDFVQDPTATPPVDFDFQGLHLSGLELDDAVEWITAQARARKQAVIVTPNINRLHLDQTSEQGDRTGGAPACRWVPDRRGFSDPRVSPPWPSGGDRFGQALG